MQLGKPTGIVLMLGCLVVGGSALAVQPRDPESIVRPTRFKFSESLRKEIKTESGINSSSTESAEGGQATLEFDLPLAPAEGGVLAPSTPFVVKAGSLEFRSTLDQDPDYRSGANSAVLKITSGTSADKTHVIFATASLHWDKKKLSVKIDAKTPAVHNVAAADFIDNLRGDIDGETKVSLQFGSSQAEATVPFHGKLNHIVRETIGLKGEVITVNLRGELKKP
ncbi:MAG: hypothetical protein JWL77_54 [Chthonomonadaceae bacterium]|nr:hypothetical protein [Chthonomonadaceae bacterium]